MIPNHSPWIHQLKRTRPVVPLQADTKADVVIIGGGIAGVVTAYFALRHTKKTVILVEAGKIAHGATGHNAGQVVSYFERPLHELVEEFGLDLVIDGQRAIESAWTLLDEIYNESGLQTPLYRFTGYAGLSGEENVLKHLENNSYRKKGGLPLETILIAEESGIIPRIPKEYHDLYSVISHADLLALLETKNKDFIAALSDQKGCLNSALFTEELAGYLIATYKDRFSFYEGSPVHTVELEKKHAQIKIATHTVTGKRVVLCTNGFENFKIVNNAGKEINTSFHHSVNGRVGYMAGCIEPLRRSPIAISYFSKTKISSNDPTGESYFYLTRRPHEHEGNDSYNLVCIGGPEKVLPNDAEYDRGGIYPEEAQWMIDDFLKTTYRHYPKDGADYTFYWHGLMGYTPSGIRRIGPESYNPVLLYNLGCNGVGILPSIYGGKKISEFLSGKKLPPSIFDPYSPQG